MFRRIDSFVKAEDGAVTVDWVVLTAAVVTLGIVVLDAIVPTTKSAASSIATVVDNAKTNTNITLNGL